MNYEMAFSKTMQMQEFRICKWQCSEYFFNPNLKLSPNFKFVASLVDNVLHVFCLQQHEWLRPINNVNDFYFQAFNHNEKTLILFVTDDGLVLNDIGNNKFIKISDFSHLGLIWKNINNYDFIEFSDCYIVIVANKTLILLNIEANTLATVDLTDIIFSSIINVKVRVNFSYVFSDQFIHKINNNDGTIASQYILKNCLDTEETPKQFYISSDESNLLIHYDNEDFVFLEFDRLRSQIPFSIKNQSKSISKISSYWDLVQQKKILNQTDEPFKPLEEDYLLTSLPIKSSNKTDISKPTSLIKKWNFTLTDKKIKDIEICSNFIYIYYCTTEDNFKYLLLIDSRNGKEVDLMRLEEDNIMLFGVKDGNPNLILSKDYISVVIYVPKQDILLNKIMLYSDSSLADRILQLNSWHDVTLPLNFLQWGLHNHQLGLVALYLKSQKKVWSGSRCLTETVDLNKRMLNLIFSVIDKSNTQGYLSTFDEQILKLTLQYLLSISADCATEFSSQKDCEEFVVYYIKMARNYLKQPTKSDEKVELQTPIENIPEVEPNLYKSILERRLPQYQNYLWRNGNEISFKQIVSEATVLIMDYVISRDIKMAKTLLTKLGMDANLHLQNISETIIDRDLREFLINELPLSDEFLFHVQLLIRLEKLYSNTSFNSAKEELLHLKPHWTEDERELQIPDIPDIPWENSILNEAQNNIRSPHYSNLALYWVQRMRYQNIEFAIYDHGSRYENDWLIDWHYRLPRNDINFDNLFVPLPVSIEFLKEELGSSFCLPLTRELIKIHLTKLGCICKHDTLQSAALASTLSQDSNALKCLVKICSKSNHANVLYEYKDDVNLLLGANTLPTLRLINTFLEDGSVVVACFDQVSMFVNANNSQNVLEGLIRDFPFAAAYCLALPNCKNEIKDQLRPVLNHPRLNPYMKHFLSEVQDISLYQLLHDSVSFNVYRLFAKNCSDDSENPIPSPFITETQHEIAVDFLYYLKQGRPCFAYLQFLLHEGERNNKLNTLRLHTACALATSLAFQNSSSLSISAACVVFIELLNMSSEWLRLNIEAVSYLSKCDIVVDHSNVQHLVSVLEDNLECGQPIGSLSNCFMQKLYMFKVLVKICQMCKLKMPTKCLYDWDWLLVLITAQMSDFNVSMMKSVFNNLNQKEITEHVHMALQQTRMEQKSQVKNITTSSQTSRDILYRKLGLKDCQKKINDKDDRSESPESIISKDLVMNDDFFQSVILCCESQKIDKTLCSHSITWKNPLFATLCSQNSPKTSLIAWLSSLVGIRADDFNTAIIFGFQDSWWSILFSKGCRLFKQYFPLDLFFNSLDSLFNEGNYDSAVFNFIEFLQNCSNISEEDFVEVDILSWQTLQCIFKYCSSQYQIYQLLEILHATNFTTIFNHNVDFGILSCMQKEVLTTTVCLPFDEILNSEDKSSLVWTKVVMENLLHEKYIQQAEKVQQLIELKPNILIVYHLQELLTQLEESHVWKCEAKMRLNYWSYCDQAYLKHQIPSVISRDFFKKCCEKVITQSEKFYLLNLALKHQPDDVELEREMWIRRIKAHLNMELLIEDCKTFLTSTDTALTPALFTKSFLLNKFNQVPIKRQRLDDDESLRAISEIINQELDQEKILNALRISAIFEYQNENLLLILLAMDLVEGTVKPESIDFTKYPLLSKNLKSVTGVLEKIIHLCKHGRSYCNRLFSYYRVSELLGMNYVLTIEQIDIFSLVNSLLKKKTIEGISLAKQLCFDNCVSKDQILQFISEEVTSLISSTSNFENVSFQVSKEFLHFKELMKLIPDTSLVGSHLIELSYNDSLLLESRVELVIWAHFCFTSACNTEGIALVLHRAHQLISSMEVSHSAMAVRLLTDIGCYNEMLYVFDLLMEWDQFELLLKKGMDKIYSLKTFLLDYLWRFRHSNLQLFMMTAVRFCLYREMGDMLNSTADKLLDRASGEGDYNQVIQHLIDAAESYSKAGCNHLAQKCCQTAELVALQIYFLPFNKRILGLTEEQIDKFVTSHSHFNESYLISNAYDVKTDWMQAIYNNVIITGNLEYLNQFHNCLGVTEDIAEGIVARIEKDKLSSNKIIEHCEAVIECLDNVCVAFKLSKRLKSTFADVLMKGESGEYLRDMLARDFKMLMA